jgi:hypothetical protein
VTWGNDGGPENDYGLADPGRIIHEVGAQPDMGNDPKKSAVNKFNQAHGLHKTCLLLMEGLFVSQADKNPTWTILALSMRASEYIIDQLKKQNIITTDQ